MGERVAGAYERGQSAPSGALWLNRGHKTFASSPLQLISSVGERRGAPEKKKKQERNKEKEKKKNQ